MKSARSVAVWWLPIALCLLTSCTPREQPWNVLLVTFDTTRADRIGCYGNERIATPTLDALAASGVRFADAMSAVPITAPSHSTIHTGRYPIAHGVRDNGLFVLAEEQTTLAEILRARGYATGAAIGAYPLTARFGLAQGFDLYDDHLTGAFEDHLGERVVAKERLFFDERRAAQVNEALVPWLRENATRPFFAWVHYFDPHQPFEPPAPFDQDYADDLYNGEIAYADSRLGFLLEQLEELGVMDRTIVIFAADHGEGRGEHNEETHAVLAYQSTLHVPLIVRTPSRIGAGRVVEDGVATVDIVPTVLDLLGIEAPDSIQGRSLVPLLRGANPGRSRVRYAENLSPRLTHGWGELRVLTDGPLKYIHGPRSELFDLHQDPSEKTNLVEEMPEEAARLEALLQHFLDRNAVAGVSVPSELDDEVRQRLESLGYLHSGGGLSEQILERLREGGIAPQDRVTDINDLSAAKHLLFRGRPANALVYIDKLLRGTPDSPLYQELNASALGELGRFDEAWEALEILQRLGGSSSGRDLVRRLAIKELEAGNPGRAVNALEHQQADAPSAPVSWVLASAYQQAGDEQKALVALERALELDPGFAPARVDLAIRAAQDGATAEADRQFRRALADAPYYAKAYYNYGTFALDELSPQRAAELFGRAVELAPSYLRARLALVAAQLASGDQEAARQALADLQVVAPRSPEAATAAQWLVLEAPRQPADVVR
jgi:arylsulfatase A-like enzyme/Tfp pilus assembly protein PilF